MQARIEESREIATPIAKGERVVILAKPQIEGAGAEDDFMDCVERQPRRRPQARRRPRQQRFRRQDVSLVRAQHRARESPRP